MKKRFAIALFLLAAAAIHCPAQRNVLKGRLLGLPGATTIYTFGAGFERHFAGRWSAQLLFVSSGTDFSRTDGQSDITTALLPEVRVYVFENKRWSPFAGAFVGQYVNRLGGGGECELCVSEKSRETAPGFIFGQNVPLGKRLGLELYYGPKWRFGHRETTTYDIFSGKTTSENADYTARGFRLGWNLCWRF